MTADPRRLLDAERVNARRVAEFLREHLGDDADSEAFLLSIESETDLKEALAAVYESSRDDEALADGCRKRMEEQAERERRLRARAAAKRRAILDTLLELGERTLPLPAVTLTAARSVPQVRITDETAIPAALMRVIPERREPDKRLIKAELDARREVNGAHLTNPGHYLLARPR